jgi:hypothetical protein
MLELSRISRTWVTSLLGLLMFVMVVPASGHSAGKGRIVFVSDRTGSWQI